MILISWVPTVTLGTMSNSPQEGRGLLGCAARWHRALAFASALEDIPRDGQSSLEQSRMGKQPTGPGLLTQLLD